MYILRPPSEIEEQVFQSICQQTSNQGELQMILNYLELQDAPSVSSLIAEDFGENPKQPHSNVSELTSCLRLLNSDEGLSNALESLSSALTQGLEKECHDYFHKFQMEKQVMVKMPATWLLLTPQLSFSLIDLPTVFSGLEMEYYNKNCGYCGKNSKKNAVCLICGKVMCYTASSSL